MIANPAPAAFGQCCQPRRVVPVVLAAHVLIWTALPALLQHNLPLDVIEQLAWGREWQIVYFKHPPLPAWIVEVTTAIFGRWPPAIYLLGPLASALALFAVWRLGCAVLGPRRALSAMLAQLGVLYFTIFTPEFNHNVILLPLWAALGLAGYRACFELGSARVACARWIWFGTLAALGMLGKYTTALFLLPVLALAILHPRLRRVWAGPGPWLAILVAVLLLLPHLFGLWQIEFSPLLFPFQRAPGPAHWYDHIVNPLLFSAAQLGDIAAALLALALLAWRRPGEAPVAPAAEPLAPEVRAYLWTITWAPAGIAVAASLLLGLHFKDMWGYPMWCFIGLFLLAECVRPFTREGLRRFHIAWLTTVAIVAAVFIVQNTFGAYFLREPMRWQFPGPELARAVEQRWHAVVGTAPLSTAVGDVWIAGCVAYYGNDRPAVFIDADPLKSPWIKPADMVRRGAVLVWSASGGPPGWLSRFPGARLQSDIELPYVPPLGHPPARFGWAIVPPAR